MFSKLFGFIKKLFKKLGALLKKLWDVLRPILAFAALILIFMSGAGIVATPFLGAALSALGAWGGLAVGIGAMFLIDPETGAKVVETIGEAAGNIAGAVGSAIGAGIGGVSAGLFGMSPLALLGIGLAGYLGYRYYESSKEQNLEHEKLAMEERRIDAEFGEADLLADDDLLLDNEYELLEDMSTQPYDSSNGDDFDWDPDYILA